MIEVNKNAFVKDTAEEKIKEGIIDFLSSEKDVEDVRDLIERILKEVAI